MAVLSLTSYLRLSENGRARDALRTMLPARLRDGTFGELLRDDPVTKRWLAQLLYNVGVGEA
jgi:CCR4-NOT transcription complex subunit 9